MIVALPIPALLSRIGVESLPAPSVESLFRLVRAYHMNIPFENLDVLVGRPVSIDIGSIAQKIVFQNRGGWCYELNLLFAALLREAGFEVKLLLARVGYRRPSLGPLAHLVLLVKAESREWLVDTGFGGPGPSEPLLLTGKETRCRDGSRFSLAFNSDSNISLHRWINGEWARLYEVSRIGVQLIDLEMANHFLSTWQHSPFRRLLICVAFDGERNWSLEGNELLQHDEHWGVITRAQIKDAAHLHYILESRFGSSIPMPLIRDAWARIYP